MLHPRTNTLRISPIIPLGALILSLALRWVEGLICLSIIVHTLLLWNAPSNRSAILRRIAFAWVFISLGCLPIALSFCSSESSYHLWGIGLNSDGLELAWLIFLRASTAFASLQLLWQIIPFYELCRHMRRIGVPILLIDLFELSYRYIFILQETSANIRAAQLSRLGYSNGYFRSMEEVRLLATQTFILSMSEADLSYEGLLSRGFNEGPPPVGEDSPQSIHRTISTICLDGIYYKYPDGNQALCDVSLKIKKGERIALLGENGAGKSTLMRLLSGIAAKQTGSITLAGEEISSSTRDMRKLRSKVSLVFQNSNYQLFCPSVEDEIAFGLHNIGLDEKAINRRIEEIINQFELQDLRYLPPHKLSEGQKKWVNLAVIIAIDPDVLLLDEPTASLDRAYTRKVLTLLDKLHQEGKTIILSTHDMNLAYEWAERILVMHRGSLIADGNRDQIFSNLEILDQANLDKPLLFDQAKERQDHTPHRLPQRNSHNDFNLALYHRSSTLHALIVGGGAGALRKAKTLIQAGVQITVIAPEIVPELRGLLNGNEQAIEERPLEIGEDISSYDIIVGATQSQKIEDFLYQQSQINGQLFCSLPDPLRGNIQFPAQGSKGGIYLAVRSHYSLPEMTQAIRDNLLEQIPDFSEDLQELSKLRLMSKQTQSVEDVRNYSEARDQILKKLKR